MKFVFLSLLTILTLIPASAFSGDPSQVPLKKEIEDKGSPSKTGKEASNKIFGIPFKQKSPRQNKILDVADSLLGKKKAPGNKLEK